MGHSIGLAVYLAFSARAQRYAKRRLDARQEEGKEDADRISERFGTTDKTRSSGHLVWFHAASVGESLSILELIRRLGDRRTDLNFLVTTGTTTSAALIATRLPARTIHQFVPVDTLDAVDRFLDFWHPDLAVWTESELWPTLITRTRARGVPMILINARISQRTHRAWRWFPGFSASLLQRFDFALVQDKNTAQYLHRLGMPRSRMDVVGTLKEGSAALPFDESERLRLASQLESRPVWLAASTHDGEELIAAKAHRTAARSTQRMLLIIAPRHPARGPEVAQMLTEDGWKIKVRSKGEVPDQSTQIYLADTLGEMGLWYRLAPVCFLGGSLANIGGHNPFEPAALGSAIIHGPHIQKVADIYEKLADAGATVEVRSTKQLAAAVTRTLSPEKAAAMAHAAWSVSSSGAEVTDRALKLLLEYLPDADNSDAAA